VRDDEQLERPMCISGLWWADDDALDYVNKENGVTGCPGAQKIFYLKMTFLH
jgi:hypothetical protein